MCGNFYEILMTFSTKNKWLSHFSLVFPIWSRILKIFIFWENKVDDPTWKYDFLKGYTIVFPRKKYFKILMTFIKDRAPTLRRVGKWSVRVHDTCTCSVNLCQYQLAICDNVSFLFVWWKIPVVNLPHMLPLESC